MKHFLFIISLLLLISACNPVKQVLKDNDKFERVAQEVVKRGYCINDTVTIAVTDTVIKSIPVETIVLKMKDVDTLINSIHVRITNDLVLIDGKLKERTVTVYKTNNIRDCKYENILKDSIERKEDSLMIAKKELLLCKQNQKASVTTIHKTKIRLYLSYALNTLLIIGIIFLIIRRFLTSISPKITL